MAKYWMGSKQTVDDFGDKIENTFIDGKTKFGPWGIMTPASFEKFGIGLGLGKGQKYELTNRKFLKTEG